MGITLRGDCFINQQAPAAALTGVDSANLKESDTANAHLWDHILDNYAPVRHCEFDLFSRGDKALKYAIRGQECVACIGYTNRT